MRFFAPFHRWRAPRLGLCAQACGTVQKPITLYAVVLPRLACRPFICRPVCGPAYGRAFLGTFGVEGGPFMLFLWVCTAPLRVRLGCQEGAAIGDQRGTNGPKPGR